MTQRGQTAPARISISERAAQIGTILLVCAVAAGTHYKFGPIAAVAVLIGCALGMIAGRSIKQGELGIDPQQASDNQISPISMQISRVIDVMDAPAFILDGEGQIEAHNLLVRELFPRMAKGKMLLEVSRNPELLRAVEEVTTGRKSRAFEVLDRGAQERRLFATISPLNVTEAQSDGEENPVAPYFLVQFRDLTEHDRLAQMRSDFIANASHELRTPLASMIGFIETLRGPARQDQASHERFLAIMAAQAARMARILDDLLSLSRVEMRAHLQPGDEVEIDGILRAAAHSLEPLADQAKIAINLDSGTEIFNVRGDRDQLEQVFQNLVQNAIKYGREGGKVDISVKRISPDSARAGRIAITITDDGPGIAEEHLPRLTERFYRVDTATSRARGGTGLGLAIVKHILNRHRGELDIESKLGEGSTFTVLLEALPVQKLAADTAVARLR